MLISHQVAHNLKDSSKSRSKDVALEEDVLFKDLLLHPKTQLGLESCGFDSPSPIQLQTIPLGRCGFDLVVQSKAGTGKTCIFTLVALEALQFNPTGSTQTLIIAPTREIACQIHDVVSKIGSAYKNLHCALCIGGVDLKQDRARLSGGKPGAATCQIVIGTPGRLKQLIELNILKTTHIELFVLDEADKLMEDQFKDQIDEIYKRLPLDKQMIVTSATYPNELSTFLRNYMRKAKNIRVGKELSLEAVREFYLETKAGNSSKKSLENKYETLKQLLSGLDFTKCFIFTNYQARAPLICDNLNNDPQFVSKFGRTNYLCAELSQLERNQVFANFKTSDQKLLISTDVSARGIDIQEIELVINFDLPHDNSTYYHRIGRAGRFGQAGCAISLVSGDRLDRMVFEKSVKSDRMNKMTLEQLQPLS